MIRLIIFSFSLFCFSSNLQVWAAENRLERKLIPECLISQHTETNVYAETAIQCSFQCGDNCDMLIPDLSNRNCHLYGLTGTLQNCASNSEYKEAFIRPEHYAKIQPYFLPAATTTTVPEPTTPLFETMPTYLPHGEKCYRYANKGYVFPEVTQDYYYSEAFCAYFGWRLTKVYDAAHDQWLTDRSKENRGNSEVFLGAKDNEVEGVWRWSDGTMLNYTNWYPNEPNNQESKEHCLILKPDLDGMWIDGACWSTHYFICESESTTCQPAPPSQTYSLVLNSLRTGDKCSRYGAKCHLFHEASFTFDKAEDYCNSLGMSLTKVHSNAHSGYLAMMSQRVTIGQWWIGVNDKDVQNTFVNQDGSPQNVTVWSPGEPSNDGGEDCVVTGGAENREFWNDVSCSNAYYFICEGNNPDCELTPIDKALAAFSTSIGEKCGVFGGKSFVFVDRTWGSFEFAENYCLSINASNVTMIDTAELSLWLREMGRIVHDGVTWWFRLGSNYTNFQSGQPDHHTTCGLMAVDSDDKWYDNPCSTENRFICQVESPDCTIQLANNTQVPIILKSNNFCGRFEDKTYVFVRETHGTFQNAEDYCQKIGGEVTMIEGAELNFWLREMTRKVYNNVGWYFKLGANYTNFPDGEPNDGTSCGIIGIVADDQMYDEPCGNGHRRICRLNINTNCDYEVTDQPVTFITLKSGDKCYPYNNRGYLFRNEPMNYYRAAMYCWSYGMNLTKVYSEEHRIWIQNIASSIANTNWYIGLVNLKSENDGEFFYQDGTSPNYTFWRNGEPSYQQESAVFMVMEHGGIYNDVLKTDGARVICESTNPKCVN